MYFSKTAYLNNEYGVYIEKVCKRCGSIPAVSYIADCCGDSIEAMCLDCWKQFVLEDVAEALAHKSDFVEIEPTDKTSHLSPRKLYANPVYLDENNEYRVGVLKLKPLKVKEIMCG